MMTLHVVGMASLVFASCIPIHVQSFSRPSKTLCLRPSVTTRGSLRTMTSRTEDEQNEGDDKRDRFVKRKRKERSVDFPSDAYGSMKKGSTKKANIADEDHFKKGAEVIERIVQNSAFANFLSSASLERDEPRSVRSGKLTNLLNLRSYANQNAFQKENLSRPPNLSDLSPPPAKGVDKLWVNSLFRLSVLGLSYTAFPYIAQCLHTFVTMSPDQLDAITTKFAPGISILYGTFISLTLNILYTRHQHIQQNVAMESSIIALMARNLLMLFHDDADHAIEGCQCVADQVRTLVKNSRGKELMCIMYSDPYTRILDLLQEKETELFEQNGDYGPFSALIATTRVMMKDLIKVRAKRLSDEALALPPTHFFVLTTLTFLILLGYTLSILPTLDGDGRPSDETSLLFALLCTIYVLFYNFAYGLNNPFGGAYQIRRSSAACHLLQTKFLLIHHPLLRGEVEFHEFETEDEFVNGDLDLTDTNGPAESDDLQLKRDTRPPVGP